MKPLEGNLSCILSPEFSIRGLKTGIQSFDLETSPQNREEMATGGGIALCFYYLEMLKVDNKKCFLKKNTKRASPLQANLIFYFLR